MTKTEGIVRYSSFYRGCKIMIPGAAAMHISWLTSNLVTNCANQ